MLLHIPAMLADYAQRPAVLGFWHEPIEIRRVVWYKPDSCCIGCAVLGQAYNRLHQRNCFNWGPSRGTSYATGRAIRAHHAAGVPLLVTPASFSFQPQSISIWGKSQESRVEGNFRPGMLRFACQCGNQA